MHKTLMMSYEEYIKIDLGEQFQCLNIVINTKSRNFSKNSFEERTRFRFKKESK